MPMPYRQFDRQLGVSLLELLLSSALSLVLLSGLTVLYISLKNNINLQQGYSTIQQTERFMSYLLSQRLRMAGLATCDTQHGPIVADAIMGYDSEHLPAELQGQVVAGTDAMVIRSCVSNSGEHDDVKLVSMAYFIGDTHRHNSQGAEIYGLYQKPFGGSRLELAEGVEQLQLRYGIADKSGGNIQHYAAATDIGKWQRVHSVVLDGVMNSVEPILGHPQKYLFQQQMIAPKDHKLHQSWRLYISLRER